MYLLNCSKVVYTTAAFAQFFLFLVNSQFMFYMHNLIFACLFNLSIHAGSWGSGDYLQWSKGERQGTPWTGRTVQSLIVIFCFILFIDLFLPFFKLKCIAHSQCIDLRPSCVNTPPRLFFQ
uniref:Uncharacterized protein n=1 Tax=Fundulus heteroclitus TaxID=8078 RepID=A0A3Q2T270_FUNHE